LSRRGLDRDSQSRRRQRVSLDNNVQTKKSRSRSRNSSRSKNFGVSRQFVLISTEKCMDFCIFSSRFLNPSRLFIIFRLKRPRQCQDFSTNLDCVSTNLDNSKKLVSTRRTFSISIDLDWSRLSRPPTLENYFLIKINFVKA
jgi:hypothetical protein